MVDSQPDRRLTRVNFRRDIRWFLTALVGYLSFLILGLLLLLQGVAQRHEDALRGEWKTIARGVFDGIENLSPSTSPTVLESQLVGLRAIHGIPRIEVTTPSGQSISSGLAGSEKHEVFLRQTSLGEVAVFFDRTAIERERTTLHLSGAIIVSSTMAGIILLLLYLPRITRPLEEMLGDAGGLRERHAEESEDRYLIDTFRATIATLKRQESELKHLHEAERERADELELMSGILTRNLASGFISIDSGGRIIDMNQAAETILGLSQSLRDMLVESIGERSFENSLRKAFAERSSLTRQEIIDGDRTIGLTTVPLVDGESRFLGMLAIFTDLTDVRNLETRVRELQALADVGEISAGIAHEVRNSLSTILGYLKLARRQSSLEEATGKISAAEHEAGLLSAAVDGLLSFAGPMEPELEEIRLLPLVEGVLEGFRVQLPAADLVVHGANPAVFADPALLPRVFENLIRNSIESIDEERSDGKVEVTIADGDPVMIDISDNGSGIDPDEANLLFLPFRSHKTNGLGLGLSLARKIVLLHDGSISISPGASSGTRVSIALPAAGQNGPYIAHV